jgi:uncharacterized repeat protein (TIGR03803 family)
MGKLNWVPKVCAIVVLWTATAAALSSQTPQVSSRVTTVTFTTLFSFDYTDGSDPVGELVQAANGNLYGTTLFGGPNECEGGGCGTIFNVTTSGTLTTLHSFNGTDGQFPESAMVQDTDGEFYGTTLGGGLYSLDCYNGQGCGTVFTISAGGTLVTLYEFCALRNCPDGAYPGTGLVKGIDGNFYGTTGGGGTRNVGTVFQITPSGTLTTLHRFDVTDGSNPNALVQGADGNFYGTTFYGGANHGGTVFEISPTGVLTSLYSFCSQIIKGICTDGAGPVAGLTLGSDGNFYGTTEFGGANGAGYGTVFSITPSGTLTSLYSFCHEIQREACTGGAYPQAALVLATDGNFYGTTTTRTTGNSGTGTIFTVTPGGTLTTLYDFSSQTACGKNCMAGGGVIQDTNGNFYGATEQGGNSSGPCGDGCGTIYSLSVGLGPFVETSPKAGKAGAKIGILGTNLTGASSVTFNGVSAELAVKSATLVVATVPSGAATGKIQAVTPNGTLSSNVPFIVLRKDHRE